MKDFFKSVEQRIREVESVDRDTRLSVYKQIENESAERGLVYERISVGNMQMSATVHKFIKRDSGYSQLQ